MPPHKIIVFMVLSNLHSACLAAISIYFGWGIEPMPSFLLGGWHPFESLANNDISTLCSSLLLDDDIVAGSKVPIHRKYAIV